MTGRYGLTSGLLILWIATPLGLALFLRPCSPTTRGSPCCRSTAPLHRQVGGLGLVLWGLMHWKWREPARFFCDVETDGGKGSDGLATDPAPRPQRATVASRRLTAPRWSPASPYSAGRGHHLARRRRTARRPARTAALPRHHGPASAVHPSHVPAHLRPPCRGRAVQPDRVPPHAAALVQLARAAIEWGTGRRLQLSPSPAVRRILIAAGVAALAALEIRQQLHADLLTRSWL